MWLESNKVRPLPHPGPRSDSRAVARYYLVAHQLLLRRLYAKTRPRETGYILAKPHRVVSMQLWDASHC